MTSEREKINTQLEALEIKLRGKALYHEERTGIPAIIDLYKLMAELAKLARAK